MCLKNVALMGKKRVKTFKDKNRADRRKNVSGVNRSIVYKDTITGHFPFVLKKKTIYFKFQLAELFSFWLQ